MRGHVCASAALAALVAAPAAAAAAAPASRAPPAPAARRHPEAAQARPGSPLPPEDGHHLGVRPRLQGRLPGQRPHRMG